MWYLVQRDNSVSASVWGPLELYRVRGVPGRVGRVLPLCAVVALAGGSGMVPTPPLGPRRVVVSLVKRSLGKGVAFAKPVGTHVGSSICDSVSSES